MIPASAKRAPADRMVRAIPWAVLGATALQSAYSRSVPVARTSTRSRNDGTCVAMLGRKQRERLGRRVLGSLGLLLTVQGGVRIALGDWSYPNWWGGLVFAPFSILFGALLTYTSVRASGWTAADGLKLTRYGRSQHALGEATHGNAQRRQRRRGERSAWSRFPTSGVGCSRLLRDPARPSAPSYRGATPIAVRQPDSRRDASAISRATCTTSARRSGLMATLPAMTIMVFPSRDAESCE